MWSPNSPTNPLEPRVKPDLIGKMQSDGFDIHENYRMSEDRTKLRVGFPDSIGRVARDYSGHRELPSKLVIECVWMKESKRLGLDYFSRSEIVSQSAFGRLKSCLDPKSDDLMRLKEDKEFYERIIPKIPSRNEYTISILKETNNELSADIDVFPLSKKDVLTVGMARLITLNPTVFLVSLVREAEWVLENVENQLDSWRRHGEMFFESLGNIFRAAKNNGNLIETDFEEYALPFIRNESEVTYKAIMRGYEE